MNRFIVLSTQRSGSAFLVTSLASHPAIECHREIFLRKNRNEDSYRTYRRSSLPRMLGHAFKRRSSISGFLDQLYHDCAGIQATGFKLMYTQIRQFPEVLPVLESHDVSVIHLVRRNFLRLETSRRVAEKRGIYHSKEQLKPVTIKLDPAALLEEFSEMDSSISRHAAMFSSRPYMEITYESLLGNFDQESRRLQEFLGVSPVAELTTELVRVNSRPLADIIENYREIAGALSGTAYAGMLEES